MPRRFEPSPERANGASRERVSATQEQPIQEVLAFARQKPVAYVDETGAPARNSDGGNPDGRCGWQWVMVTSEVTLFQFSMSAAKLPAVAF